VPNEKGDRGRDSRIELDELKRTEPHAPERVNLGFGKVLVPPRVPPPLPRAAPTREPTRTDIGMLGPSPGSVAPYKRSNSPPPTELAPDPHSARAARVEAREKVAESERKVPAPAVTDSIKIELPANLKGGMGAVGKAILGAIATALVGGGGAMVGSKATNDANPPPMAIPCQQRCPLGSKQPIPPGLAPLELQATMQCCEIMTARIEAAAALTEAANARELAGKASDIAKQAEKNTPRVNP